MPSFAWAAVYNDGSRFCQLRSDGSENKYPAIEFHKLRKFVLYNRETGVARVIIHFFRPSQKLICRQRVGIGLNGEKYRFWLAGWQENRNGVNVQMLTLLFEDGHIEVFDRFRTDDVHLCEPEHYFAGEMPDP